MKIMLHPEETPSESPFQKEKVTFKDLDRKKKLEYIWDYYKWPIIIIVVAALVIGVSLPQLIENRKEIVLYAAFVNTQLSDSDETPALLTNYAEQKEIDIEGKRMMLDCSMTINHQNPTDFTMQCTQKLAAMFSANQLDVIVEDIDTLESYTEFGVYVDLEDTMSPEFINKYKDKLVYKKGQDGEEAAYAIDVSESPVLLEEGAYIIPAYASIAVNSEHPENAVKFIEYLMGE